jgi:hypothetical protein
MSHMHRKLLRSSGAQTLVHTLRPADSGVWLKINGTLEVEIPPRWWWCLLFVLAETKNNTSTEVETPPCCYVVIYLLFLREQIKGIIIIFPPKEVETPLRIQGRWNSPIHPRRLKSPQVFHPKEVEIPLRIQGGWNPPHILGGWNPSKSFPWKRLKPL